MGIAKFSAPSYLDYNAGAPLRARLIELQREVSAIPGNASSQHAFGRRARAYVERAREQIAALVGASPEGVVFTGSGSEANALALNGRVAWVSAIEHLSVLEQPSVATRLQVTAEGLVDQDALRMRLETSRCKPSLLSVMAANNETGVLQPIEEIARLGREHAVATHCDATQAAGRIAIDMAAWRVLSLTLSAHKIGGPQGIGALIVRESDLHDSPSPSPSPSLNPLLRGGGQERGLRAGTESVAAIAAFGEACEEAGREQKEQSLVLAKLRDEFERLVLSRMSGVRIVGFESPRLVNTSCLIHPSLPADVQIMHLDLEGIAVSSGSACSSGKIAPSHVLEAMGLSKEDCRRAIRVSIGRETTRQALQSMCDIWCKAHD